METTANERTRTYTWHDPMITLAAAQQMSGRQYLEAMKDGRLPPPPMIEMLGFQLVEIEEGRVVFEAHPQEYFFNGIGLIHGGFAATLLDSAIGCAALAAAPHEKVATTMDLQIRYFRPLTMASGVIRAEGWMLNLGRTTATAEGRIVDGSGKVCMHGTSTLALLTPDPRHFPGG
jgi:uncharacterized protein (TIGR00369 family)